MKKTKIICTMGPNTNNEEIMRGLAGYAILISTAERENEYDETL